MAGKSVIEDIKVSSEELVDALILENAQLRLELHAQKIMSRKLTQAIEELELLDDLKS